MEWVRVDLLRVELRHRRHGVPLGRLQLTLDLDQLLPKLVQMMKQIYLATLHGRDEQVELFLLELRLNQETEFIIDVMNYLLFFHLPIS